jgi:glycine/D-amino acid oxidase-like deaminating enzyme
MRSFDVVILGGGIFGVSAAAELARRGLATALIDAGLLPHPDAASTDISKIVRLDYGADAFYTALMERALPLWRAQDEEHGQELFHETGLLVLSREPLTAGSFELESYRTLTSRGHPLERLDGDAIAARFPAWRRGLHVDGYYNPQGGWVESAAVVERYAALARSRGATLLEGRRARLVGREGRAIELEDGERIDAGAVVLALGAWTTRVIPELADRLTPVAQPVLHFAPLDAQRFRPPAFVPWVADIARTGWYGFSATPSGVVKIANHGPGRVVDAEAPRVVPDEMEARARVFLAEALVELGPAPCVQRRSCLYCDSYDGDPWIARHPTRAGVVVAAGGSGHAFKFAPLLGDMIAEVVLDGSESTESVEWRARFAWRATGTGKREQARAGSTA